MDIQVAHRFNMGYGFEGIPIHAARGVHEYAARLANRYVAAPTPRVLDIGSGSGALAARLLQRNADVLATDINLDGFKAKCRTAIWNASDEVGALPDIPGTYDAAIAVEILEHVENPRAALRNLKRMLKPDGVLIVSTPHTGSIKSRLKYMFTGAPCYFGPKEYTDSGHQTLLPDWILENHIRSEGFEILQKSFAGTTEKDPLQRAVFPLLSLLGRTVFRTPKVDDGDGACVFVVARPKH